MRAQQITRATAAVQLVLILPAALFIASVVLRYLPPFHDAAQRTVMLYTGKMWTLWFLLLTLPFWVLVTGCLTLVREWNREVELPNAHQPVVVAFGQPSVLFVAAITLLAAGILATVVLHMLAN